MTSLNDQPEIPVGEGQLYWPTVERQGDRYGCVVLEAADGTDVQFSDAPENRYGQLIAEVLETREIDHMGDVARGLVPETPEVGEKYALGQGTLWTGLTENGAPVIGLRPADDRDFDWLDPAALYRVVGQTVRLTFTPLGDGGE